MTTEKEENPKQINPIKGKKKSNQNYFLLEILKKFSVFIPIKKDRVTFVISNYSGDNIKPIIKKLKKNPEIDIKIIRIKDVFHNNSKNFLKKTGNLCNYALKLLRSKMIVTTHSPFLNTKKNISLELWHGLPLKSIRLMNKNPPEKGSEIYLKKRKRPDYINSSSNFSTTILNSAFGLPFWKYVVLGYPRNDYLYSKKKEYFKKTFGLNKEKILFYLPTYREKTPKKYDEFIKNLTFDEFNLRAFNNFLKKNKMVFLMKPHPQDNNLWKGLLENKNLSNFKLIFEEDLENNDLNLYEILGQTDLLITDYSSVYLDYLLTNKPMLFIPSDLNNYRKNRGFILEPYELWTPGPKVHNQNSLQREIIKCINNPGYYKRERGLLKNIFHRYQDGKSNERVANFILEKMKNNKTEYYN